MTHFHYPGGGFPLEVANYRIERIAAPTVPTAARVREQLEYHAQERGKARITDDEIRTALVEAQAAYPAAAYGWELAPYRITVQIPGAAFHHVLVYQHAARFLKALGVLRHCGVCQQWTIAHDPAADAPIIVCDRCGYRSEDWL